MASILKRASKSNTEGSFRDVEMAWMAEDSAWGELGGKFLREARR
jgi:hypothetical protein